MQQAPGLKRQSGLSVKWNRGTASDGDDRLRRKVWKNSDLLFSGWFSFCGVDRGNRSDGITFPKLPYIGEHSFNIVIELGGVSFPKCFQFVHDLVRDHSIE